MELEIQYNSMAFSKTAYITYPSSGFTMLRNDHFIPVKINRSGLRQNLTVHIQGPLPVLGRKREKSIIAGSGWQPQCPWAYAVNVITLLFV